MVDWSLLAIPAAAGLRNIAGWAEASLKDGEITAYEWQQLGGTVLRVGIISVGLLYGLGEVVDLNAISASGSAVVLDFILSAIRKKE